jgi:N,N'-diacetyllegionaminate synthase
MKEFRIGSHTIGEGKPCLIVAEVAQAHDGSLGMAHAFIDAIADAGADAVKFQTHIAAAESTPAEPWRVKFSLQDASRYAYWKRMEFTEEEWQGLKRHADERKLVFLSSPFSLEAVDLLLRIGVAGWKVASGEVANVALFERIAATGLPVLLSTGMSPWSEIDSAVEQVKKAKLGLVVMQTTSRYPTAAEQVGLNVLQELRQRYTCPVGLSDHSGTEFPGLAATALGISMLEVHITFSKQMFGPDVPVSLTMDELTHLVKGVRFIERMLSNPVDKDAQATELESMRALFTKSVVACRNLPNGTVLTAEDLIAKKPGTGIPAARLSELIGRRLKRDVVADALLREEDLD